MPEDGVLTQLFAEGFDRKAEVALARSQVCC